MRSGGQQRERLVEELERLRRQNAELMLYKHTLDQLPLCTILYDHTGKAKYRNRAAKDLDGYADGELIGLSREEYLRRLRVTPRGRVRMMSSPPGTSFNNGIYELTEATLTTRDGLKKQVLLASNFIYDHENYLLGACGCTFDISTYARENYTHVLWRLMNIIPSPVFHKDARGLYRNCNMAFEKEIGLSRAYIIGKTAYELYPRDLADKYHEQDAELLSNPGVQIYEIHFPHADGTKHDAILTKATYRNSDGEVAGLVGVITDITERKHAEKELRLSRERFLKIFDAGPGSMAIISKDGRFIEANRSFLITTGYTLNEVIGKTIEELNLFTNPADFQALYDMKGIIRNREVSFRNQFGETGVGLFSTELIELNGEECILAVLIDITERKHIEREMARLDRMNLVGQMAAGIGHEIRNPLTTVRGFLQLMSSKEECSHYGDYMNISIGELDRANAIITEFLTLARNRPVDLQNRDINKIVEGLFPLMLADATISGKQIVSRLGEVPDLPLDEKEIRQLILNLVRNGLEAMSEGGRLEIKTFQEGNDVVFAVRDEGSGIDPAIMDRLGTPFLTTKDDGTGLGIAVCYSIAGRHNASIDVKTSATGTTFFVRFRHGRAS